MVGIEEAHFAGLEIQTDAIMTQAIRAQNPPYRAARKQGQWRQIQCENTRSSHQLGAIQVKFGCFIDTRSSFSSTFSTKPLDFLRPKTFSQFRVHRLIEKCAG